MNGKICPKCGNFAADDAALCRNCGYDYAQQVKGNATADWHCDVCKWSAQSLGYGQAYDAHRKYNTATKHICVANILAEK